MKAIVVSRIAADALEELEGRMWKSDRATIRAFETARAYDLRACVEGAICLDLIDTDKCLILDTITISAERYNELVGLIEMGAGNGRLNIRSD